MATIHSASSFLKLNRDARISLSTTGGEDEREEKIKEDVKREENVKKKTRRGGGGGGGGGEGGGDKEESGEEEVKERIGRQERGREQLGKEETTNGNKWENKERRLNGKMGPFAHIYVSITKQYSIVSILIHSYIKLACL